MKTVLQIHDRETDEIVHEIDVTGKTGRNLERVEDGLYRKVDWDRFYVEGPVEIDRPLVRS